MKIAVFGRNFVWTQTLKYLKSFFESQNVREDFSFEIELVALETRPLSIVEKVEELEKVEGNQEENDKITFLQGTVLWIKKEQGYLVIGYRKFPEEEERRLVVDFIVDCRYWELPQMPLAGTQGPVVGESLVSFNFSTSFSSFVESVLSLKKNTPMLPIVKVLLVGPLDNFELFCKLYKEKIEQEYKQGLELQHLDLSSSSRLLYSLDKFDQGPSLYVTLWDEKKQEMESLACHFIWNLQPPLISSEYFSSTWWPSSLQHSSEVFTLYEPNKENIKEKCLMIAKNILQQSINLSGILNFFFLYFSFSFFLVGCTSPSLYHYQQGDSSPVPKQTPLFQKGYFEARLPKEYNFSSRFKCLRSLQVPYLNIPLLQQDFPLSYKEILGIQAMISEKIKNLPSVQERFDFFLMEGIARSRNVGLEEYLPILPEKVEKILLVSFDLLNATPPSSTSSFQKEDLIKDLENEKWADFFIVFYSECFTREEMKEKISFSGIGPHLFLDYTYASLYTPKGQRQFEWAIFFKELFPTSIKEIKIWEKK